MDLGSAVRVLLRRWWVLAIGLVLTLGAAGYLYTQAPPRYQATARMLLLLPAEARVVNSADSPFLYLPDGLQVLAGMVATAPKSRAFHSTMTAAGLTSQYEVGIDTASPIITISVEGSDAQNVIATRDRVIRGVQDELLTVQQQEKTPQRQLAHARVYAIEATPDLVQGDRTRVILMVLGIGGLVTLLAAFLIDRAIQLHQERSLRQKRRLESATDVAGEPDGSANESNVAAQPMPAEVAVDPSAESLEWSEVAVPGWDPALDADQTSEIDYDESQVAPESPPTDVRQAFDEERLSNEDQPAVAAKKGEPDQVAEPEQVADLSQEEETADQWVLYTPEYSPDNPLPESGPERLAGNKYGASGATHDENDGSGSVEDELAYTGSASSRA
jgi:hypothetical protein